MQKLIRIGTRGSLLALAQTDLVMNLLQKNLPDCQIQKAVIKTAGDKQLDVDLRTTSLKDMFVKEIEQELLNKSIDIAVHSMKDMPVDLPAGLTLGAVPKREDPVDIFISGTGKHFQDMPKNSVIGTSSLRREIQMLKIRQDLTVKPIRGNVDSRIKKLGNEYDGIILAAAGLKRLGLFKKDMHPFNINEMLPAPGQGAIFVECRENDDEIKKLLSSIECNDSRIITNAERHFSLLVGGGCKAPVGAFGEKIKGKLILHGMIVKSGKIVKKIVEGSFSDPLGVAEMLVKRINE